jgi:endo-1,4-beta-xylanase
MIEGVPRYNMTRRGFLCVPIVLSGLAQPTATLQDRAAHHGITYGGAVAYDHLLQDQSYRAVVLREMNMIVPENELKWDTLRPSPTHYDFTKADYLMRFARLNDKTIRGHCIARHKQLPVWFAAVVNSSNASQILTEHITTVVRRFAGQMHSWDVVNEQVETWDANVDGLRVTPWLTALGYDYMDLAFRTAHAGDPNAILVCNGLQIKGISGACVGHSVAHHIRRCV